MQRCFHLYPSGTQCGAEALDGTDMCEDHAVATSVFEGLADHPMRKLALRIVAFTLLLIFLVPFYYTLKALYLSAPVELQERS